MRVVPAKMDRNSYEKLSISESARSLKKYGSTSKHVNRNESYVKHYVGDSDTLQGIALKYDVTIEQIRRANRLWASDSLFLREYLLIPVPDSKAATPISPPPEITKSPPPTQKQQEDDSEDENLSRFLGKIDASIASTKKEVRKVQGNSEFVSDLNLASSSHTNNNVFSTQQVTIVPNKGRSRKNSSMQRLEQQQDELFEL